MLGITSAAPKARVTAPRTAQRRPGVADPYLGARVGDALLRVALQQDLHAREELALRLTGALASWDVFEMLGVAPPPVLAAVLSHGHGDPAAGGTMRAASE
mgnify:CR=1 FL=1